MEANLTIRQKKAIAALVIHADITEAAKEAGVSRDTIYRWMRSSDFKAALDEATTEAIGEISRSLVTLGIKAIQTIDELIYTFQTPPGTRLRAADIVLTKLLQVRELVNLENRVTELESKIKQGNK